MLCCRDSIFQFIIEYDLWTTVKNILKYHQRKVTICSYGGKNLILTKHTDSEFQFEKDAKKSTSKAVIALN